MYSYRSSALDTSRGRSPGDQIWECHLGAFWVLFGSLGKAEPRVLLLAAWGTFGKLLCYNQQGHSYTYTHIYIHVHMLWYTYIYTYTYTYTYTNTHASTPTHALIYKSPSDRGSYVWIECCMREKEHKNNKRQIARINHRPTRGHSLAALKALAEKGGMYWQRLLLSLLLLVLS